MWRSSARWAPITWWPIQQNVSRIPRDTNFFYGYTVSVGNPPVSASRLTSQAGDLYACQGWLRFSGVPTGTGRGSGTGTGTSTGTGAASTIDLGGGVSMNFVPSRRHVHDGLPEAPSRDTTATAASGHRTR